MITMIRNFFKIETQREICMLQPRNRAERR